MCCCRAERSEEVCRLQGAISEPAHLSASSPPEGSPAYFLRSLLGCLTSSPSCQVYGRSGVRKAQINVCSPGTCLRWVASEYLLFPSHAFLPGDLSHSLCKEQTQSQADLLQESSSRLPPASVLELWTSIWRVRSPWMEAAWERLPSPRHCPGTSRRLNQDWSTH